MASVKVSLYFIIEVCILNTRLSSSLFIKLIYFNLNIYFTNIIATSRQSFNLNNQDTDYTYRCKFSKDFDSRLQNSCIDLYYMR